MPVSDDRSRRDQRWTVGELLTWTQTKFADTGIDEARLDAEHLLAHALGCGRMDLYLRHDELVEPDARGEFRELVRRRLAREPVAYIEGIRGFHALDLDLQVDSRVLVPRPETELLVDWLLEEVGPVRSGPPAPGESVAPRVRVLDIGTGSGAIALAVKHARPELSVTACDRSEDALQVARGNARNIGVEVEFFVSDLVSQVPTPEGGWSIVAANLPYIPSADMAELQPEVRGHEPKLALDGGPDGLVIIRRLLEALAQPGQLQSGARVYLEFGIGQSELIAAAVDREGWSEVEIRPDLAGIPRVLRAIWAG